jgi:hypothetical protein
MSELLADTASKATAETNERKRMDSITLFLPSLRPKHVGVLKVFRVEVITSGLSGDYSSLGNRNIFYEIIFRSNPMEATIGWSVKPSGLILNPINIDEFL